MIDTLLAYIAPHHCYSCVQRGSVLCQSCYDDIISDDFGRCLWCARPCGGTHQCAECMSRLGTAGAWTVGERSDALQNLVGDYKYESVREAARTMAGLLGEIIAVLPDDTVVTHVPTIWQHVRQRGFDHAEMLAQSFARQRDLVHTPLLRRTRQYSHHELTKRERLRAAKQAFSAVQDITTPVLLVDDIVTTGATLQACVGALRDKGASSIYVAVVARQMLK